MQHKRITHNLSDVSILDQHFHWQAPVIGLEVASQMLWEDIHKKKASWIAFLQNELKSAYSLQIQARLAEVDKGKLKPYTSTEKWRFLVEKYSLLDKFRTTFGLELE